jgi:phosphorylase kinase alpha/beta subunit
MYIFFVNHFIIQETDAAILAIIAYPAFAVEDAELAKTTRNTIKDTLLGNYGCRRFIRDGYKTVIEVKKSLFVIMFA